MDVLTRSDAEQAGHDRAGSAPGWYRPNYLCKAHYFDPMSPLSQCRGWAWHLRGEYAGAVTPAGKCTTCRKGMGQ